MQSTLVSHKGLASIGGMSAPEAVERPRRERLSAPQRQRQIVDAAAVLFRNRHYGDISLDEIAEELGVTRGLINHHFGTKRNLYVAVVRRILTVGALPVPEYVHGQTLADRLTASVAGWLDVVAEHRELWLDAVHAQGLGDPEVRQAVEDARDALAHQVAAVMGVGPVDALSGRTHAHLRVCVAGAEAAALQWVGYERVTRDEVHELVLALFEEGAARLLGPS